MVDVKKLTLKTLHANHPEASALVRCTNNIIGTRYFLIVGEDRVDCTEEFLGIAHEAVLIKLMEEVKQL